MSAEFYVWAACIGFNITMLFTFFLKGAESRLMNKLLTSQAFGKETARCLAELGTSGRLIKFLLRDGSTLRKVVTLSGENDDRLSLQKGARRHVNFDEAKFYIADENRKRAESIQRSAMKWYLLPLFCALSIGIAIGVHYLIPVFQNW